MTGSKLSFGYSKDLEGTLKSWVPKLRDMVARILKLEENIYSDTDEVLTNKLLFGSPVYRKVVDVGSLPNATAKLVDHGIDGLARILDVAGFATNGTLHIPLPYVNTSDIYSVSLYVSSTEISVGTGTDRTSFSGYVILEYTKLE